MRTLLCGALAAGILICSFTAAGAATAPKKKSPSKSAKKSTGSANMAAPASGASAATTHSATHSATARRTGKKGTPTRAATTWRNRQMAPTPERYKEIQGALVAKGYLKAEDANGGWNQNSVDALKKFQSEQNIESSGKINSLSLIALGLGPKRDTAPVKTASEAPQSDR